MNEAIEIVAAAYNFSPQIIKQGWETYKSEQRLEARAWRNALIKRLALEGLTNKQIAARMRVTTRTVQRVLKGARREFWK